MLKVAFVINPVAGIGGPLALKGSDTLSDETGATVLSQDVSLLVARRD